MRKKITLFFLFALAVSNGFAQQAILPAGGNGTGSGGSFSYSIGLIDYTNFSNATGYVELWVQHTIQTPAPVATSPQNFCSTPVTLASIAITGTNIKW